MNTNRTTLFTLAACLVLAGGTFAQEQKINRSELPKAVEKTVQEQSKGATIRGFSKEMESGQITYEAEMLVNGHTKDEQIDANGAVLEIEEQMDLQALPADVGPGCTRKLVKATLQK
jgi:hypothetical protein